MIYLIGGPPKCGKTTLAKQLSKSAGISWISTDTLQDVIKPYVPEQEYAAKFPASTMRYESNDEKYTKHPSAEVIAAYRQQAETVSLAIERFIASEVADGNNYIIEGYHIEPNLISKLVIELPESVRGILMVRKDAATFLDDITKNTISNDWVQTRTKDKATFPKIAAMIIGYGSALEKEAGQQGIEVFCVDNNFHAQLRTASSYLLNTD